MTTAQAKPYTSRTRIALAIARGIAASRGDSNVTPVHVVLGLLREGENAAVAVLHHGGTDLGVLRPELEMALGSPPGGTQPDQVALPLTPGEQLVAKQARAESDQLNDEYVGPEHLLLAVVGDEESLAGQILARHRVDRESVLTNIRAVIRQHHQPAGPPSTPPAA